MEAGRIAEGEDDRTFDAVDGYYCTFCELEERGHTGKPFLAQFPW